MANTVGVEASSGDAVVWWITMFLDYIWEIEGLSDELIYITRSQPGIFIRHQLFKP